MKKSSIATSVRKTTHLDGSTITQTQREKEIAEFKKSVNASTLTLLSSARDKRRLSSDETCDKLVNRIPLRQSLHVFSPWTKKIKQTSPAKQSSSKSAPPKLPQSPEPSSLPQQSTEPPPQVSHSAQQVEHSSCNSHQSIPSLMSISFSPQAIQSFEKKLHHIYAEHHRANFTVQSPPLVQPLMSIIQPLMSLIQNLQHSLHHLIFLHHNSAQFYHASR